MRSGCTVVHLGGCAAVPGFSNAAPATFVHSSPFRATPTGPPDLKPAARIFPCCMNLRKPCQPYRAKRRYRPKASPVDNSIDIFSDVAIVFCALLGFRAAAVVKLKEDASQQSFAISVARRLMLAEYG